MVEYGVVCGWLGMELYVGGLGMELCVCTCVHVHGIGLTYPRAPPPPPPYSHVATPSRSCGGSCNKRVFEWF